MNVTATLFGQMITFVIFVWFIKAYLWEPLTKAMDDRSNKIADGLAAAEKGQLTFVETRQVSAIATRQSLPSQQ